MEFNSINLNFENSIAILTINRPKALNALNSEVLREINEALNEIEAKRDVYVLIVTGEGEKAFVAGADISEMKNMTPIEGRNFSILGNNIFKRIENLNIPTIGAINGFALGGGCELALSLDIRIASTKAKFGQPEVSLGITPGFGGTQRLSRVVGSSFAKELIFTGRIINAEVALSMGLINSIYEPNNLMSEAIKLSKEICKNAQIAVSLSKKAINTGMNCDIERALSYESEVFSLCFSTEDQKEGMGAFIEKREKSFKNK